MTFQQQISRSNTVAAVPALTAVQSFLVERSDGLAHAAYVLGGSTASSRTTLLVSAVSQARHLTSRHRRQLVDLHKLLTLQAVGDPDRIESACFARISPGSAIVEEICLLADALEAILHRISEGEEAEANLSAA